MSIPGASLPMQGTQRLDDTHHILPQTHNADTFEDAGECQKIGLSHWVNCDFLSDEGKSLVPFHSGTSLTNFGSRMYLSDELQCCHLEDVAPHGHRVNVAHEVVQSFGLSILAEDLESIPLCSQILL